MKPQWTPPDVAFLLAFLLIVATMCILMIYEVTRI